MSIDSGWILLPGERLVWSGQPRQGLGLSGSDCMLIPFSLLWAGFAFFWELTALSEPNAPFFFKLWGIPFVFVGVYVVVGRFWADAFVRRRTFHSITKERILIRRPWPVRSMTALNLDELSGVTLMEQSGGRGTIRFENGAWSGRQRGSGISLNPALDPAPQFIGVTDARDVFALIQRLQQTHQAEMRQSSHGGIR